MVKLELTGAVVAPHPQPGRRADQRVGSTVTIQIGECYGQRVGSAKAALANGEIACTVIKEYRAVARSVVEGGGAP